MDKKANHQANVVSIETIKEHTNADSLELIIIGGYQVVAKKGQFKVGDLAVYICPDSVVPQTKPFEFIWLSKIGDDGLVSEKDRRITVRRFRKEYSEGLLLPISDFTILLSTYGGVISGQDVSDVLGITHYEPVEDSNTKGEDGQAPKIRSKYPRSFKGWKYFIWRKICRPFRYIGLMKPLENTNGEYTERGVNLPIYDVDSFKHYSKAFVEGEEVVITEKIHGSNARFLFLDGKMYAGSRRLWKSEASNCVWRQALKQNPWIESWCRANEGSTLYGEVTPTQGPKFTYGCKPGEVKFFAFDIYNSEGKWIKPWPVSQQLANFVPIFYIGPFSVEVVSSFIDGKSTVKGADHIREGVVITPTAERHVVGLGRLQLKLVSNKFLEVS